MRVSVCVCVFLSMCECDCVCLSLCVSANFSNYNTDFAIFVSTGFRKWFFYLSVFVSTICRFLAFEDSTPPPLKLMVTLNLYVFNNYIYLFLFYLFIILTANTFRKMLN